MRNLREWRDLNVEYPSKVCVIIVGAAVTLTNECLLRWNKNVIIKKHREPLQMVYPLNDNFSRRLVPVVCGFLFLFRLSNSICQINSQHSSTMWDRLSRLQTYISHHLLVKKQKKIVKSSHNRKWLWELKLLHRLIRRIGIVNQSHFCG